MEKSIKQLAEFYFTHESIKKAVLGDFFGNENEYN